MVRLSLIQLPHAVRPSSAQPKSTCKWGGGEGL